MSNSIKFHYRKQPWDFLLFYYLDQIDFYLSNKIASNIEVYGK